MRKSKSTQRTDDGIRATIEYLRTEFGELRHRVVVNYRPSERSGWVGEVITAFLTARRYQDEVQIWP